MLKRNARKRNTGALGQAGSMAVLSMCILALGLAVGSVGAARSSNTTENADEVVWSPAFGLGKPVPVPTKGVDKPAVARGDEGYLVVWSESRGASDRIFAARIRSDGKILDPSGFKITRDGSERWQRNVSVAARGDRFLVVWEEYHNETARDIYGARVDWDGEVLDPGGIALAVAEGAQEGPEAASEGGDYLVVWETRNPSNNDYEIRGSIVPGEGDIGDPKSLLITAGENWRSGPDVDSNGEVYLAAWQDGRNSRERGDDVYGARIGSDGQVLDNEAFPISGAQESQREPTVAGSQDGFFVAWRDGRNGRDGDIFGTQVAEGSVMEPEGIPLAVGEAPQVQPQATSDGEDYRIGWIRGERQKRIGVVKFAQGGEVEQLDRPNIRRHPEENVKSFSLTGGGGSSLMARLTVDRGKGRIRFSSFDRKTSPLGDQFIPTLDHEQGVPRVAGTPNGALVVWKDWRQGGANSDLWGARVSPTGEILDPKGLPIAVKAGEPLNFEVATDGRDYLVAWAEQNVGAKLDIYATVVAADGEVLHPGGLQITDAAENQNDPAIASNGQGYLVAWVDKREFADRRFDLFGAQLNAKGERLNEEDLPLITEESSQLTPALAAQGPGFFLAWQDSRTVTPSGPDPAIYGTRLGADGAVLDSGGERISSHDDTSEHPVVATLGERSMVAWQEEIGDGRYEIHGSWITLTDEGFEADPPAEPLVSVDGNLKAPRIAGAGRHFLLTWHSLPSDEGEPAEIGVMPVRSGEPMEGLTIDRSQSPEPLPDVAAMGNRYLLAFGDRLKGRLRLQSRLVAVDQPLLYLQNSRVPYLPGAETMNIAPDAAVRLPSAIDRGRLTLEATITSMKGVGESLQLRGEASGGPAKLTIESDNLLYDGTVVGSWSSDSEDAGTLSVAFNDDATDAATGAVIRAVSFASDAAPAVEDWRISLNLTSASRGTIGSKQRVVVARPPSITAEPSSHDVKEGQTLELSVEAEYTGEKPDYTWKKDGVTLFGRTGPTLRLKPVRLEDAGRYQVIVSNSAGSAASKEVDVNVEPDTPELLASPQAKSVSPGATAFFRVIAEANLPLHYQWQFESEPLEGETNAFLKLENVTQDETGDYRVLVSNASAETVSDGVALNVAEDTTPPVPLRARTWGYQDRIVVAFSEAVTNANGDASESYALSPDASIEQAKQDPVHPNLIVLTVSGLSTDDEYTLTIASVSDEAGNEMAEPAELKLDRSLAPFREASLKKEAFQDNFEEAKRDPAWTVRGSGGDVYTQSDGVLRIGPAADDPNHLLYEAPYYDRTDQEVLARFKVLKLEDSDGFRGGVAAAVSPARSEGINYLFRVESGQRNGKFLNDLRAFGPEQPFEWQQGSWYWIRLAHRPGTSEGGADAYAKIWRADNQTPEPLEWESWDYAGERFMRRGFAGITAGSHGAQAEFEIDYFLLTARGLRMTEIAREPITALEPRLTIPALSAEGSRFKFEGVINDTWVLQKSVDLQDWVDVRTIDPSEMPLVIERSSPVLTEFYRVKKE